MRLLMIGFLAAALGGCVIHAHPVGPRAHIHDDVCGHYWYNGTWYVAERHHHGPADASVVALDGGLQAGDADSVSSPAGTLAHVFALASVESLTVPPRADPTWLDAAQAAGSPWIAAGPERPPKP